MARGEPWPSSFKPCFDPVPPSGAYQRSRVRETVGQELASVKRETKNTSRQFMLLEKYIFRNWLKRSTRLWRNNSRTSDHLMMKMLKDYVFLPAAGGPKGWLRVDLKCVREVARVVDSNLKKRWFTFGGFRELPPESCPKVDSENRVASKVGLEVDIA